MRAETWMGAAGSLHYGSVLGRSLFPTLGNHFQKRPGLCEQGLDEVQVAGRCCATCSVTATSWRGEGRMTNVKMSWLAGAEGEKTGARLLMEMTQG